MTSAECTYRLHTLRRLTLGELPEADAAALRTHTTACARCATRLTALEAERATFLAHADVAAESARILAAAEAPPARAGWLRAWRPWLAAATTAAVVLVAIAVFPLLPRSDDGHRLKGGGAALALYVNRPQGPLRVEPGAPLAAGNQVQFRYAAAGRSRVYLVSIDGRRAISLLHPAEPGGSAAAEPGPDRVLPGSIVLDDALGPERVFALFSDQPLAFEDIERAVRRALAASGGDVGALDRLEWDGVDQATVWFLKVP